MGGEDDELSLRNEAMWRWAGDAHSCCEWRGGLVGLSLLLIYVWTRPDQDNGQPALRCPLRARLSEPRVSNSGSPPTHPSTPFLSLQPFPASCLSFNSPLRRSRSPPTLPVLHPVSPARRPAPAYLLPRQTINCLRRVHCRPRPRLLERNSVRFTLL